MIRKRHSSLSFFAQVGRWEDARKTLTNLWGERFVDAAIADLEAVAEAEKLEKDEASWADMWSPRYRKGGPLGAPTGPLEKSRNRLLDSEKKLELGLR